MSTIINVTAPSSSVPPMGTGESQKPANGCRWIAEPWMCSATGSESIKCYAKQTKRVPNMGATRRSLELEQRKFGVKDRAGAWSGAVRRTGAEIAEEQAPGYGHYPPTDILPSCISLAPSKLQGISKVRHQSFSGPQSYLRTSHSRIST